MKENCIDCLLRTDADVTNEELFAMTRYIPYRMVKDMGISSCCFFEKTIEQIRAVIVYLDIKGFTAIVDSYMKTGRSVADLQSTLSDYYSVVIETIREFGGSVYQFAGDSIIICFDQFENEKDARTAERAIAAIIRVLGLSDNYNIVSKKIVGFSLYPKIGMSLGDVFQVTLGTPDRYMSPVLTGKAVVNAIRMEERCDAREIIAGPSMLSVIRELSLGECFEKRDDVYYLHTEKIPENFVNAVERPDYVDIESLFENPRFYNRAYTFISPIILNQIKNNVEGFSGDYRSVTCCMVRFDGVFTKEIGAQSIVESYESLNKVYEIIQDVSVRFGGYCGRPDLSDKGIVFPVFFGMPLAIESKEKMAVLFANELISAESLSLDTISISIGISTGTAYAGEFGANMRKDFTIVGNAINFSARLMMNAHGAGRFAVFIDDATQRKIALLAHTEKRNGLLLKGFQKTQNVFQFHGLRRNISRLPHKAPLIGRENELRELLSLFEKANAGNVTFAPVIGGVGIGKSYVAEEFVKAVQKKSNEVSVLYGRAYSYQSETPFFPWRDIVKTAAGISEDMKGEKLLVHVLALFSRVISGERIWISYFLSMLGYAFAENQATKKIDAAAKRQHLYKIVRALLLDYADSHPSVIVLEDMQYCDSLSLHMLEFLFTRKDAARILVMPISRESETMKRFFSLHSIPFMSVSHLSDENARLLTRTLLQLDEADKELENKINDMANGNPFFIEAVVDSLVDGKVLVKNYAGLFQASREIDTLKIPYTVQDVVLAQLNTVSFEAQVICKNASAIGDEFSTDELHALIAVEITDDELEMRLDELVEKGLLVYTDDEKKTLRFRESLFRNVFYKTMIETTRRSLNRLMISYYVKKYGGNLKPFAEKLFRYALETQDDELTEKYRLLRAEAKGV